MVTPHLNLQMEWKIHNMLRKAKGKLRVNALVVIFFVV
jgi:hypothetical protein